MPRALLLALALLAPASVSAQLRDLAPTQRARIDSLFAPFDHDGSPGYGVGVIVGGRLAYARGFGRANLDDNVPVTPETSFHLASLSKQFTAAAVALLIQEGKLSLETPVDSFFPEVRKYGADLRIKHLVYFTSGLPDYTTQTRPNGTPWFSPYYFTIDDAIAATLAAPALKFAPGTQWEYSNVNYMLLAKIVERVSGMPLADFLEQRLFRPLGMRHTHLDDDATLVVPGRATGYAPRGDSTIRSRLAELGIQVREGEGYVRLVRNSPHYGGSGVFSSIDDLARWDENFRTPRVGGAPFVRQMLQRMRFTHDKENDAFGLVFGEFRGHQMIWFSGGDLDASTYMARLPDDGITVIVLSNLVTGDAEGKAMAILRIILGG